MATAAIPGKSAYEAGQPVTKVPWSTGFCGCFSDVSNCCMTFWCPCVTFGRIAEIADRGSSSCALNAILYLLIAPTGLACLLSCLNRSKLRKQYSLKGSGCGDFLAHYFCGHCALCQEYRELENRGFDVKLGWNGSTEKQRQTVTTAPQAAEGMAR